MRNTIWLGLLLSICVYAQINNGGGGGGSSVGNTYGFVLTSNGLACNGSTDDTNAMNALITSVGTSPAKFIYPSSSCVLNTISFPRNITHDFSPGGAIKCVNAATVSIHGLILPNSPPSGLAPIFVNCSGGTQGTIDLGSSGGGYQNNEVFPEWWGIAPDNAGTTAETAAMQAAIIGAYGSNRTNGTGLNKYNRCLVFSGNYNINAELKVYHLNGFCWKGVNRLISGITQTTVNQRIVDGQSDAYGSIWDMQFGTSASQDATHPLLDFDFSGSQGADIKPQFIDCYNCTFLGNGIAAIGFQLAKSGGSAQGSNINFYDSAWQSFTIAGFRCGTPTSYASNALQIGFQFGDMQGMTKYGIAAYGCGYVTVYGTTMENQPWPTQFNNNGFDVYCEATQGPCVLEHVRSESLKLIGASSMRVWDSGTGSGQASKFFTPPSTCLTGTSSAVNQIIWGSDIGGDGAYYLVSNSATYGGLCATTANGGSSTTITVTGTPWSANQWQGQQATIFSGTGQGEYCLITSSTSNTITCSGGWVSNYINNFAPLAIVNPDATSQFIVEPQWSTNPTSSGSVTFARMNFDVIEGNLGAGSADCDLRRVSVPGGKIDCAGSGTGTVRIEDVTVSRPDWMAINNALEDSIILQDFDNVAIDRGNSRLAGSLASAKLGWKFQRNGLSIPYFDYTQKQVSTKPICWSAGLTGGGTATLDACIRGDGSPGASSGRVQIINSSSGIKQVTNFNSDGSMTVPSVTFSALPSSANGSMIYCSDCTSTCSAGSSTGQMCVRVNNAWTH